MGCRMEQGSNYDPLHIVTENGVALDVSSAQIIYTVKENKTDEGIPAIQKKNVAAGGDSTQISMGPEDNQFTVHIEPADTAGLDNLDKEYHTETKIIIGGSTIKRMNTLYIEQSLTA